MTAIKLYTAAWSLILSGLWLATNSPVHPSGGWPASLIALDVAAWWVCRS